MKWVERALLRAADMSNERTHSAGHNDRDAAGILADFRAARDRLIALVESIDADVALRQARHPRLERPMRLVDHLAFAAEHDDHHLARITKLRTTDDRGRQPG